MRTVNEIIDFIKAKNTTPDGFLYNDDRNHVELLIFQLRYDEDVVYAMIVDSIDYTMHKLLNQSNGEYSSVHRLTSCSLADNYYCRSSIVITNKRVILARREEGLFKYNDKILAMEIDEGTIVTSNLGFMSGSVIINNKSNEQFSIQVSKKNTDTFFEMISNAIQVVLTKNNNHIRHL